MRALLVLLMVATVACDDVRLRPVDDGGSGDAGLDGPAWPVIDSSRPARGVIHIPPPIPPDGGCEELITVHLDADGDGFGSPSWSWSACELAEGYSLSADDCDDSDRNVNPEAPEVCGDGDDDDCDGQIDEGCIPADGDGDGDADGDGDVDGDLDATPDADEPPDGAPDADIAVECAGDSDCGDGAGCTDDFCIEGVCFHDPVDWDGDGDLAPDCGGGDCDDSDPEVWTGATEICDDEIDQDCSGSDEACACPDTDGDGFEAAGCGGADCADSDPLVFPGASEICGDGLDNDCEGGDAECPDPCAGLDCDDEIDCTEDSCLDGVCVHVNLGCLPDSCLGHRPYYFCRSALTWVAAQAFCRDLGLDLVAITSEDEQDAVASAGEAVFAGAFGWEWWGGGTDEGHDSTWVWSSGEAWGFEAWDWGEPNNFGGAEGCQTLYQPHDYAWNDNSCAVTRPFICEAS